MYTWPFWPLSVVALPLPPTRALFIDESPGSLRCAAIYSTIFRLRRQIITNSTSTAKAPATNRISVTLSIFLLLLFEILDQVLPKIIRLLSPRERGQKLPHQSDHRGPQNHDHQSRKNK